MNRASLIFCLLLPGAPLSTVAALQFTNLPSTGIATAFRAAAQDGVSRLLVVGDNSRTVLGVFNGSRIQLTTGTMPLASTALKSATFGSGFFLAGGDNSLAYRTADGANWIAAGGPFAPSTPQVTGLAFSAGSGRFTAAGSAKIISYANSTLAWSAASLPAGSFLESYRGATRFGANGFAACGIRGTVRISADGSNWTVSSPWSSSSPDLRGIAWNGGQTLVAVGTNGAILASTDAGGTWSGRSSGTLNTLNAIAYSGVEFLAVGQGGKILRSTDGGSWAAQSAGLPSGFNANLTGVVFGSGGSLNGVGLLVGEGGTLVLAGTPPAAPSNPVSQTNCSDSLPNIPPLSVDLVTDSTHPAGTLTVDWYDSANALQETGSLTFSPTNTQAPANGPVVLTFYAKTRDLRTGFSSLSSTPATLTLYPRPTAHVTGSAMLCNGEASPVQAALTGAAPWTVTWSSNGTPILTNSGIMVPSDTITQIVVNPNLDAPAVATYSVSALSDFFACEAFSSNLTGNAEITVNPLPTVSLSVSGPTAICTGGSTTVRAVLTGLGPWTLTLASNGVSVLTTNLASRTTDILVNPVNPDLNLARDVTYAVAGLVDNGAPTACAAGPLQISNNAVVRINPLPTASLSVSGPAAICNGSSTTVRSVLTGLGPWTLTLASNGVSVLTTNLTGKSTDIVVSPANPDLNLARDITYTVASLVDNGAATDCAAGALQITNNAVVRIDPLPTASLSVSGPTAICNGSSTTVRSALTGLGPWTLTLASNGVSVLTTNLTSKTTDIVISPVNTGLDQAHNATYTVAGLVDNGAATACAAGALQITNNAVVRIDPLPTVSLSVSGPAAICNGSSTTVRSMLTGLGPWTLTLASNGISVLTTNLAAATTDILVTPVNPDLNQARDVTYTVAGLVDNGAATACAAGALQITNNAVVQINPLPTVSLGVSGPSGICNGSSTTLRSVLTGLGPWTLTLSSNGVSVLTTNLASKTTDIVVSPVNSNLNQARNVTYTVAALLDEGAATGCSAGVLQITNSAVVRVDPLPTASLTLSGPAAICSGSSTTLRSTLTGLGPWTLTVASNDVSVLATNLASATADIVLSPRAPNLNQPHTAIYTVAGLVDNGAATACPAGTLQLTNNAVVVVNPLPTASLSVSGPTALCSGSATTLRVVLTGFGPWTLNLASNGVSMLTTNLTSKTTDIPVSLVNPGLNQSHAVTFTVVSLVDNGATTACAAGGLQLTNNAVVTVNPLPALPVSQGDQTNCAGFPNPSLSVSVPGGVTVDWYNGPTNGATLVASGTTAFTPPPAQSSATYYAEARELLSSCTSTGRTAVTVYQLTCPMISSSSNAVIIQWFGALELQTAFVLSNAPSTTVWQLVTNGVADVMNSWTNPVNAQQQFFRVKTGGPVEQVLSVTRVGGGLVTAWVEDFDARPKPTLPLRLRQGTLGTADVSPRAIAPAPGAPRLDPNASP